MMGLRLVPMALHSGERRGPFEILSPLGSGGMGEVYRARDTRLGRTVAIKVLPSDFAQSPERIARFEREARLLAALNDPHVAAIHGIEEAEGQRLLVLECVEGETLAERLATGPLPLEDALTVAGQIAAGMESCHAAGIIHRDLKPSNVMIRQDGSVKILDFGLARPGPEAAEAGDLSRSPTVTTAPTASGTILGTAAYMSPEQARGKALDRRTDIFSFGCVLYECLTGRQAFRGETISDTLAAILKSEPDWEAFPPETPTRLRDLLRRCLRKDPRQRLHDIADARIEIEEISAAPAEVAGLPAAGARAPRRASRLAWAALGLLIGAVGAFLAMSLLAPRRSGAVSIHATLPLPAGTRPALYWQPGVALSPDGRTVVFGAVGKETGSMLFRRRLDAPRAEPLPGTEGATGPFFSPDGTWVAFFTQDHIEKVPVAGGAPVAIARVPPVSTGGAWTEGGEIVFAGHPNRGFSIVSASGGPERPLTKLDASRGERSHRWPQVLPGDRGILATVLLGEDFQDVRNSQIAVFDLKGNRRAVVLEGSSFARYVGDGRLVFVRGKSVFTAPFDLSSLSVTGAPTAVPEKVAIVPEGGYAHFAGSADGTLVFLTGPPTEPRQSKVVLLDRRGGEKILELPPAHYTQPTLSPDGKRLALMKCEGWTCKVDVFDRERRVLSALTPEPGRFLNPVWSTDGSRLAFTIFSGASPPQLAIRSSDGSGAVKRATDTGPNEAEFANSWSPDGSTIAYTSIHLAEGGEPGGGSYIGLVPAGGGRGRPWFDSPHEEAGAAFSPDGKRMAYVSDESGRNEVYVRPYPGPGSRLQVSRDGGAEPVWTRGGRELLYRRGDEFFSVDMGTVSSATPGSPRLLFSAALARGGQVDIPFQYTASADGTEIVGIRLVPRNDVDRELAIVTRWPESLARSASDP
jgi:Tol biopolymer transport system component